MDDVALTPGRRLERAIVEHDLSAVAAILREPGLDLNAPCDPEAYGSVAPLVVALRANDPAVVSLLLSQPQLDVERSLPAYDSWTWARSCSLEVLERFLAHPGSDVRRRDGNGRTLLHEVVADPHGLDKLPLLLTRDPSLADAEQADGTTPLYRAVLNHNLPAVTALVPYGVDVNRANRDNRWTPLMVAVRYDDQPIVRALLDHPDIDVNAQSDVGDTALHLAAEEGRQRSAAMLLAHPAVDVNRKNALGWTPLIRAAFGDNLPVMSDLLARPDLDVNLVDRNRRTALHWAVMSGNAEAVRLLLDHPEINVGITDHPDGLAPLQLARALDLEEIVGMLERTAEDSPGRDELSAADDYEPPPPPGPPPLRKPFVADPPLH